MSLDSDCDGIGSWWECKRCNPPIDKPLAVVDTAQPKPPLAEDASMLRQIIHRVHVGEAVTWSDAHTAAVERFISLCGH